MAQIKVVLTRHSGVTTATERAVDAGHMGHQPICR